MCLHSENVLFFNAQ